MTRASESRGVRTWLLLTVLMIFAMVAIGGLTRLTRSGLSIVEWKPISGVIPPITEEQWQAEFTKYKQYPEYQKVNKDRGMTVDEFKSIFYWEFSHRLLGRLIGFVFAIPLLYFALRRRIKGTLATKLVIALLLGGLQGLVGWLMVKSGLVDMPRVSHYRLATHLGLALFLMCFIFWIAQDLRFPKRLRLTDALPKASIAFLVLVSLQILFGALTAGLRAGHFYNTFPTMNGFWFPPDIGLMGGIRDIFENPVTVQFIHRCLGWLTFFSAVTLGWIAFRKTDLTPRSRFSLMALAGMASIQFLLGVLTLLHFVPVGLGSAHQMGACILLILSVQAVHSFRTADAKASLAGSEFPRQKAARRPDYLRVVPQDSR